MKPLLSIAKFIARVGGYDLVAIPELDDDLVESAKALCLELEKTHPDTSGEFKRSQVFRCMTNRHPNISPRMLGLAIEVAICSM